MKFTEATFGQSKEMPAKIILYGVPKIGKSSLAAQWPEPFFINIEGGLDYLPVKVRATPRLTAYEDVMAWLRHIYDDEKFTCGTLVIDSMDWLESLAQAKLVKDNGAKGITDPNIKAFAYHRGVADAAELCINAIKWLNAIHEKKGIKSVIIAHSQVKEVNLPGQEAYQRNEMKLSKNLGAKMYEWADLVLFATHSFHVSSEGKTSEPRPVLLAGGNAAFLGGGRMLLSKELPLNYQAIEKEICQ